MNLGELPLKELLAISQKSGLHYRNGPFTVKVRSDIPEFLQVLVASYPTLPVLSDDEPAHFRITMSRVKGLRRWLRPQVQFQMDGLQPFEPYPQDHAFPMYEWGFNWCIGSTAHTYLILHSAVVEKDGRAVILPAIPGSGKSTLCAGLVSRGWRLLSDEFAIVRHSDGALLPLPKVAPLKNESIAIIRQYAPGLELGPLFERTRKGTVAHMRPPPDSLARQSEVARPRWLIFPRYRSGQDTCLQPQARAVALTKLTNISFNYPITMAAGFHSLARLVRSVDCFDLPNGDLHEAVTAIENLLAEDLS